MTEKLTLSQMEPIARQATREALQGKVIPESLWEKITLSSGYEGDHGVFELYVPGEHSLDAMLISVAKVHRLTREVATRVSAENLVDIDSNVPTAASVLPMKNEAHRTTSPLRTLLKVKRTLPGDDCIA